MGLGRLDGCAAMDDCVYVRAILCNLQFLTISPPAQGKLTLLVSGRNSRGHYRQYERGLEVLRYHAVGAETGDFVYLWSH